MKKVLMIVLMVWAIVATLFLIFACIAITDTTNDYNDLRVTTAAYEYEWYLTNEVDAETAVYKILDKYDFGETEERLWFDMITDLGYDRMDYIVENAKKDVEALYDKYDIERSYE